MASLSLIVHCASFSGRKSFFIIGVSQGLWNWASRLLRMKLKRALRMAYRVCLVNCRQPSLTLMRKESISSGVIDARPRWEKCSRNFAKNNSYALTVFFLWVHFVVIQKQIDGFNNLHGPPPEISRHRCRFDYSNLILNISLFKDNFRSCMLRGVMKGHFRQKSVRYVQKT
jgi:hypothetical protein